MNTDATTWKIHGNDLNGSYGGLHGIGGLIALRQGTDTTRLIHDAFGHVLATLPPGSQTPVWHNRDYNAYRQHLDPPQAIESGGPIAAAHAWRGYRTDATGLIHMGARYYHPETARFISPDPLGHSASADLYSFANGDPVNFVDPTGRARQSGIDATGKDPGYDFISYSVGLAQGFAVDGAWGTAKGLWSLASSPLDSARSLGSAVYNYRDTYQALKFGIGDYLNKVQSGDPRAIGLGSFELLTALVPVSKAKYLSRVDNFAPSTKGVGSSFSGAGNKPTRVFWSGGSQAREAAETFAKQSGGQTLEMTKTGKFLDTITTDKTYPFLEPFWNQASKNFAKGAGNSVEVFQSGSRGVRLESVWTKFEYPQLIKQGTDINYNIAP